MIARFILALALAGGAAAQTITTRTIDTGTGAVTGMNVSHAVVGGFPVMSYYETRTPDLFGGNPVNRVWFARNNAADGSGTWSVRSVGIASGGGSAVAEVAGNPALVYQKDLSLYFARNTAADGSGTWTESYVSWDGGEGPVCLGVIDGNPAAVFRSGASLYFARSHTADGATAWQVTEVDQEPGGIGNWLSLAVVGGKPAIAYRVETDPVNNGEGVTYDRAVLRFARCATADGSGAWTRTDVFNTLSNTSSGYFQNSLAVIDGKPAIAYDFAGDLFYTRSATADGSGAWTGVAVESAGTTGQYPTLAAVAGYPAISHYKSTGDDLRFTRCATADGMGTWTTVDVDTAGSVGSFAAMAIVGGNPAIGYFDASNGDLKWTRNNQPDASGNWSAVTVDNAANLGIVGSTSYLTTVAGNPAVAYFDTLSRFAKYARATTTTGATGVWTTRALAGIPETRGGDLAGLPAFPFISDTGKLSLMANSAADGSGTDTTTTSFTDPWETYLIDTTTATDATVAMASLGANTAGITYQDRDSTSLKYAWLDFSAAATASLRLELVDGTILPNAGATADSGNSKITIPAIPKTYVIRNTAATPVVLTGFTLAGPNAADFPIGGSPATLAAGATLQFTVGFTPSAVGPRAATLTIASNAPVLPDLTLALTGGGRPLDLLEQWRQGWFGTALNAGVGADDADADGDGYCNYFEFAMGCDPRARNSIATAFALNGGNMELTYTRSKNAFYHGVDFEVPWSETLVQSEFFWDWNYGDTVQTVIGETATTQTVKAVVPMGTAGKRFLHVEAW